MLPSMTSSPTWTTRPPSTLGSTVTCSPIGPAVEPAEHVGQPLLLGRGQRRPREVTRADGLAAAAAGQRRTAARSRASAWPACGPVSTLRSSCSVTGLTLPDEQPVQQRRLALGGRLAVARGCGRAPGRRRRCGRTGTARPRRSSSSPRASAASRDASIASVLARVDQVDRARPALPGHRLDAGRASVAETLRAEQPAGQRRPLVGLGRTGRTAPGAARSCPSSSRATANSSSASVEQRRPGGTPLGRPARSSALDAPAARRRIAGVAEASSAPSGRGSLAVRRGHAVQLRRGTGRPCRGGGRRRRGTRPTTRPARSTASAPIWPRSSLTTCWRCAGQLLLAARDDPGRLLLRLGRAAPRGSAGPRRGPGRGSARPRCGPRPAARGTAPAPPWPRPASPRPARCRPRSPRGGPGRPARSAARRTSRSTKQTIANAISPMMISPNGGISGLCASAARMFMLSVSLSGQVVRAGAGTDQVPKMKGTTKPIRASASESAKPRKA